MVQLCTLHRLYTDCKQQVATVNPHGPRAALGNGSEHEVEAASRFIQQNRDARLAARRDHQRQCRDYDELRVFGTIDTSHTDGALARYMAGMAGIG